MYLLDVNVLIALGDPGHVQHARARAWFLSPARQAWATCPITENGFVRILAQPSYMGFAGGPDDARAALGHLTALPGHQFWPDEVSLCDTTRIPRIPSPNLVTDLYLLALAVARKGKFATLDQRLDPALIPGARHACFVLP